MIRSSLLLTSILIAVLNPQAYAQWCFDASEEWYGKYKELNRKLTGIAIPLRDTVLDEGALEVILEPLQGKTGILGDYRSWQLRNGYEIPVELEDTGIIYTNTSFEYEPHYVPPDIENWVRLRKNINWSIRTFDCQNGKMIFATTSIDSAAQTEVSPKFTSQCLYKIVASKLVCIVDADRIETLKIMDSSLIITTLNYGVDAEQGEVLSYRNGRLDTLCTWGVR